MSICIFHKKGKKKNQIKIKKIGNDVMNIVQISIALHCCIQSPHLLHFRMKVACICIPKNYIQCIDFSLKMKGPLKESISCLPIRLSPLVLLPIGLFYRTQSPRFYAFGGLKVPTFVGLKVLIIHFRRTQSPRLYLSYDSKSSLYLS